MKYENISVSELCFYLIGKGDILKFSVLDDWMDFSESDMYAFIEEKTSNFDIYKFKYFMQGLRKFAVPFNITYENGEIEEHPELMFVYNLVIKNKNESLNERINAVQIKYSSVYKGCSVHPICTTLLEDFSEMAEAEYKRVMESTPKAKPPKQRKQKPPKPPLTFAGLFISPYSDKIDLLLEQLRTNGLTKTNNKWSEWETGRIEKNETSKFYFYLKRKKVLNEYDKTPALICFNEKFGIEVYTDKEIQITERFVSIRNLTNADKTATKTELLDKFDTVFTKWIEKIELK